MLHPRPIACPAQGEATDMPAPDHAAEPFEDPASSHGTTSVAVLILLLWLALLLVLRTPF